MRDEESAEVRRSAMESRMGLKGRDMRRRIGRIRTGECSRNGEDGLVVRREVGRLGTVVGRQVGGNRRGENRRVDTRRSVLTGDVEPTWDDKPGLGKSVRQGLKWIGKSGRDVLGSLMGWAVVKRHVGGARVDMRSRGGRGEGGLGSRGEAKAGRKVGLR